jgi:transposase-like protein
MLRQLERGPATTTQIIVRCIQERGHGLTPHSRAADLRRSGYDVRCDAVGVDDRGRQQWQYRLVERPVQLELV